MTTGLRIRDFVYLDGDRLYSLYSQVFEGVADQIVKSKLLGEVQTESQKGGLLAGQIAEAQFAEVTQLTENKVLHDHMYEQLEAKLAELIKVPSEITKENYRSELAGSFILKVSGRVEIQDYDSVRLFAERFNEIVGGIAFASVVSRVGVSLHAAETLLASTVDKKLKADIRKYIERLKNPKKLAQEEGFYLDEQSLATSRLFVELFYPDGFEVIVNPGGDPAEVVYRGVVDRKWLRVRPTLLKALYGGAPEDSWTMVGHMTYMPKEVEPTDDSPLTPSESEAIPTASENPDVDEAPEIGNVTDVETVLQGAGGESAKSSMRDPFRMVFAGLSGFERMFLESEERTEIIIYPLAIYREVEL
jgi:hypothetical protein